MGFLDQGLIGHNHLAAENNLSAYTWFTYLVRVELLEFGKEKLTNLIDPWIDELPEEERRELPSNLFRFYAWVYEKQVEQPEFPDPTIKPVLDHMT